MLSAHQSCPWGYGVLLTVSTAPYSSNSPGCPSNLATHYEMVPTWLLLVRHCHMAPIISGTLSSSQLSIRVPPTVSPDQWTVTITEHLRDAGAILTKALFFITLVRGVYSRPSHRTELAIGLPSLIYCVQSSEPFQYLLSLSVMAVLAFLLHQGEAITFSKTPRASLSAHLPRLLVSLPGIKSCIKGSATILIKFDFCNFIFCLPWSASSEPYMYAWLDSTASLCCSPFPLNRLRASSPVLF